MNITRPLQEYAIMAIAALWALGILLHLFGVRRAASELLQYSFLVLAYAFVVPMLPWWLQLLLGALIGLGLIRFSLTPFLGKAAAAFATGSLAADVLRCAFRIVFWPFRSLHRLLVDRWS